MNVFVWSYKHNRCLVNFICQSVLTAYKAGPKYFVPPFRESFGNKSESILYLCSVIYGMVNHIYREQEVVMKSVFFHL